MDKVFWALLLVFILTQEGLLNSTSTAGPSSSSSTSCQAESKNINFKLTSKDPDATIELKKLIVSEKKWGKEVDEYIIDLTEKRVFLDKDPQSRNQLDVEKSSDASHTCKKRVIPVIYHRKFFWIFRKILGWEREINTAPKPSPEVAPS